MFTRPSDLSDSAVADAVASEWGLVVDEIGYAAVGFGSHHWRVSGPHGRSFVTVDDLDARRRNATDTRDGAADRLQGALDCAVALRDAGLGFIVAPNRALDGGVLRRIDDRYVVAVYDHVEGVTSTWGPYDSRAERLGVLDRLVAIHAVPVSSAEGARLDDFAIPGRDQLQVALEGAGGEWGPGPFAESAEQLLREHAAAVTDVLVRYDGLARVVGEQPDRFVVTHGEPHRANTIVTEGGVVLIDWDTALRAPPERDLWMLIDEEPAIAEDYAQRTGIVVDNPAVQLYRLWWDLCEVSLYVAEFRAPHADTEDASVAWSGLREHLDPGRWITRTR